VSLSFGKNLILPRNHINVHPILGVFTVHSAALLYTLLLYTLGYFGQHLGVLGLPRATLGYIGHPWASGILILGVPSTLSLYLSTPLPWV
jgi:hypothetical protein